MSDLGTMFVWSAVQVTIFLVPAAVFHLVVSRRSQSSGAWLATCALALTLIIGVKPLVPWPRNQGLGRATAASSARGSGPMTATAAANLINDSSGSEDRQEAPTFSRTLDRFVTAWSELAHRPIAPPFRFRAWGTIIAAIGIAGAITGLARLLIGLWAIRLCRQQGRAIADARLLDLLAEIRVAMACHQPVEIREVPDLPTPAAAGWRRPIILLPIGWRGWNDADCRAVLAHELAHIHRSDYAAGLVARFALALQFYHPLVHWLTKRLILQQELAADAVGALLAGGTDSYLRSLSRLALEQDTPPAYSPARAFLPSRGTLIRRIAIRKKASS
jgi:beta-lactamase regulating signal transducer with metallopeptidase domain